MEHKCKYFTRNQEGRLVCVQCGEPSPRETGMEDKNTAPAENKIDERRETKQIWPPEAKRQKKVMKKTGRRR